MRLRGTWLVVRREWDQRVRSTSFRLSTLVAAAIVAAIISTPQILGGNPETTRTVGVVGETSSQLTSAIPTAGSTIGLAVSVQPFGDLATAEAVLGAGDVEVLLVDQRALVWKAEADDQLAAVVSAAVQGVQRQRAMEDLGLTAAEQQQLLRPPGLASRSLEPATEETAARFDLAMIGLMLLFVAISFYGGFLLMGVVEEKSSRVIEVLLARLRPIELLSGKIAGIGLVGLAQLTLVAGAGLLALAFTDNVDIPATTGGTLAWLVLWFVLGYGFYAVLYGAAGSLVSRQEETQSLTLPITVLLLVAYMLAMGAAESPDSVAAIVGSFVPPTAPMVMIARIANGTVPWWQIALSVAVMIASIAGMTILAGRIYAGAVLRIGRRVGVKDAWRAGVASA
jgi:ABC-2 type transport system permease protein